MNSVCIFYTLFLQSSVTIAINFECMGPLPRNLFIKVLLNGYNLQHMCTKIFFGIIK